MSKNEDLEGGRKRWINLDLLILCAEKWPRGTSASEGKSARGKSLTTETHSSKTRVNAAGDTEEMMVKPNSKTSLSFTNVIV